MSEVEKQVQVFTHRGVIAGVKCTQVGPPAGVCGWEARGQVGRQVRQPRSENGHAIPARHEHAQHQHNMSWKAGPHDRTHQGRLPCHEWTLWICILNGTVMQDAHRVKSQDKRKVSCYMTPLMCKISSTLRAIHPLPWKCTGSRLSDMMVNTA
jgi:hypothetical protein